MPVIFTLGTEMFSRLNAQETQKVNFPLHYHLGSGLLGTEAGVMLRQGSGEGGSTGHLSVASSNLQSKTLAVFPDSCRDLPSDLQGAPRPLRITSARK